MFDKKALWFLLKRGRIPDLSNNAVLDKEKKEAGIIVGTHFENNFILRTQFPHILIVS